VNTQRVLVVFSAAMIVLSVALATLGPRPETLGHLLARTAPGGLVDLQNAIAGWSDGWIWTNLLLPLLQRPAWLPPASLALLAIGLALSIGKTTHRSRRRS
jgi:hypothetical protein